MNFPTGRQRCPQPRKRPGENQHRLLQAAEEGLQTAGPARAASASWSRSCHPRGAALPPLLPKPLEGSDWQQPLAGPKQHCVLTALSARTTGRQGTRRGAEGKRGVELASLTSWAAPEKRLPSAMDGPGPLPFLLSTPCLCLLIGTRAGFLPESVLPD